MDTWSTLEQRFRELASEAPELYLNFSPPKATWETIPNRGLVRTGWKKSENGWCTPSDCWKWYTTGNRGELHVDEFHQLITRADRLLSFVATEPDLSRFVGIALDRYGDAAMSFMRNADTLFRDRPPNCIQNGADLCALTAGYIGTNPERFASAAETPLTPVEDEEPSIAVTVTAKQVASFLHIELKSLVKTTWPDPTVKARGNRPAIFDLESLLPSLELQYPDVDWTGFGSD